MSRVMVRATNWLGDAVMSLPAVRAIRGVFPHAHLAVVAKPWVADLYARERAIDRVIPVPAMKGLRARREFAARLRAERFDGAILLQNAFDAALIAWMAGIPERIGYKRDGRRWLLTRAIPVPEPGDIPRHERFYYLELLRRAGMIERLPAIEEIRLDGAGEARASGLARLRGPGVSGPVAGVGAGGGGACGGARAAAGARVCGTRGGYQSGRRVRRRQAVAARTLCRECSAARHSGAGFRICLGTSAVRAGCRRDRARRRLRTERGR